MADRYTLYVDRTPNLDLDSIIAVEFNATIDLMEKAAANGVVTLAERLINPNVPPTLQNIIPRPIPSVDTLVCRGLVERIDDWHVRVPATDEALRELRGALIAADEVASATNYNDERKK